MAKENTLVTGKNIKEFGVRSYVNALVKAATARSDETIDS